MQDYVTIEDNYKLEVTVNALPTTRRLEDHDEFDCKDDYILLEEPFVAD